jgi:uncharacterized protein
MALVFLDTSALVKLYLPEIGATWLRNFVTNKDIVISELALFESATMLRRRYVEGEFTKDASLDLLAQIVKDSLTYKIVSIGNQSHLTKLTDLAFDLPQTLRLRALDAIHLLAALVALQAANNLAVPETFTFVSSDAQLLKVAQWQDFATENPEDYP